MKKYLYIILLFLSNIVLAAPPTIDVTVTPASCPSESDGEIFVQIVANAGALNSFLIINQATLASDGPHFTPLTSYNFTGVAPGNYFVIVGNGSESTNESHSVGVVAPNIDPSINITSDDADNIICIGDNITFTSSVIDEGVPPSYQWYLNGVAEPGETNPTYSNNTLSDGDQVYAELTQGTLFCGSGATVQSNTIIINVNTLPVAIAGVDQNICTEPAILGGNLPPVGQTGTWSIIVGTGTFADPNDPSTAVTNLTAGTNTFRWTVADDNAACPSAFDDVDIVFTDMTTADAGLDQDICVDNTILTANAPKATETGTWSVIAGTGTFADPNDPNTGVTGLTEGINTFRWTISDNNAICPDTFDETDINYIIVSTADAGTDQNVCTDNTALAANAVKANETGTWSVIVGTGTFADPNDPNTTVSGLTEGSNTFQWTISDNNALCPSTNDQVDISYTNITVADVVPNQNVCVDNSVLAANAPKATETGTWSVIAGTGTFADPNNPNTSVSGLTEGINTFRWTISDNNAICPDTFDETDINYIIVSTADAGTDQNVCTDNTALAANAVKANETGTWTVIIGTGTFADPNDPNTTVSGLTEGSNTFQWTISDNNALCSSTNDQVDISYTNMTVADAGLDQSLCTDNTILAANAAKANETGTWSVIAGTGIFADSNDPNTAVTGLSMGDNIFRWTIIDNNAICPDSFDEVTITQTTVTAADAGLDQTVCIDQASLAANSPGVNETGTWSIVSGNGVFADLNDPNTNVGNLSEGLNVFRWTISDDLLLCTSSSDLVNIEYTNAIVADAGKDSTTCGLTLTLYGNDPNPGTGIWSQINGPGTGTFIDNTQKDTDVTVDLAGTYTFRWTVSQGGCSTFDEVDITFFEDLALNIDNVTDATGCGLSDGAIDITPGGGSGNFSFDWSGPNGFNSTNEDISGLGAGFYILTITDIVSGCIEIFVPIEISEPVNFTATLNKISDQTNCFAPDGEFDLEITGGSGNYTFSWSGPNGFNSADEDVSTLEAGTYSVNIIDNVSGCQDNLSDIINGPLSPAITIDNISNTITCGGNEGVIDITITNGSGDYTFDWSGPNGFNDVIEDISSLTAGLYTIVVTDNITGCIGMQTDISVQDPSSINVNLDVLNNVTFCNGNDGAISISVSNGSGDYSYNWQGPNGFSSASEDINGLEAGIYKVIITDNITSCTDSLTDIAVDEPTNFSIALENVPQDVSQCGGADGSISIIIIGGSGDFSYNWSGPNGFSAVTEDISGLEVGSYDVEVTDNISGCIQTLLNIAIDEPANCGGNDCLTVQADPVHATCDGGNANGEITFTVSGGMQPYTFTIDKGDGPIGQNSNIFINVEPGIYTYRVEDSNTCIYIDTVTVAMIGDSISIETTPVSCKGGQGTAILKNLGGVPNKGYNFELFHHGNILMVNSISSLEALSDYIIPNLGEGNYQIQLTQDRGQCIFEATIDFVISAPDGTLDAEITQNIESLPDQATGQLDIEITNESGSEPYFVSINLVKETFSNTLALLDLANDSTEIERDGNTLLFQHSFTGLIAGVYQIRIEDANGCFVELIDSIDYNKDLFIPNVFTPNNDGYNDVFYIRNLPEEGTNILITNRWGNKVYQNDNYQNDWNGDSLSDGVYYYKIVLPGGGETYRGWVEIWRSSEAP